MSSHDLFSTTITQKETKMAAAQPSALTSSAIPPVVASLPNGADHSASSRPAEAKASSSTTTTAPNSTDTASAVTPQDPLIELGQAIRILNSMNADLKKGEEQIASMEQELKDEIASRELALHEKRMELIQYKAERDTKKQEVTYMAGRVRHQVEG